MEPYVGADSAPVSMLVLYCTVRSLEIAADGSCRLECDLSIKTYKLNETIVFTSVLMCIRFVYPYACVT